MAEKAHGLRVEHVRHALLREFGDLIDLSDSESGNPQDLERQTLSRALAALAVRRLTGCDSWTAADAVVDGRNDQGIDAVAFGDSGAELVLVQAKWSDKGTAGLDKAAALKIVDGFRQLESRDFRHLNDRFLTKVEQIKTVLSNPNARVNLVFALLGEGQLAPEVSEVLDRAKSEYNGFGPLLDYRVVAGADVIAQVKEDLAGPDIELDVRMDAWLRRDYPTEAYHGTLRADLVAAWYAEHGDRLFNSNVRKSLGITAVNRLIIDTLLTEPETFWLRNNGITILCADIGASFPGRRLPTEPIDLRLTRVSVINGAQTVSAIHHAFTEAPEQVSAADVSLRVIQIGNATDGLATEITRSTNTQNHMERRDFIALDPTQVEIREEFDLLLNKTYVFKRGEVAPTSDAGCSAVNAGIALACAHPNPTFAVRVKKNTDLLWEEGTGGAYSVLFGSRPPAQQIWRSVQLHRAVIDALKKQSGQLENRASAIADHGDMLIAHAVIQIVGLDAMEKPEKEWDAELAAVSDKVRVVLHWMIDQVDRLFTPTSFVTSTFSNPNRCAQLVEAVLRHVRQGDDAPDVDAEYQTRQRPRRTRSRNAVHVLVDADRIPSGESLRYVPLNDREQTAMRAWLEEDSRRSTATWVPDRTKPLLWAADSQQYSPSGLVMHMWQSAGWTDSPVAIQGTRSWHIGQEGSLADLAARVQRAESEEPEVETPGNNSD
jgi:hypothetical protein